MSQVFSANGAIWIFINSFYEFIRIRKSNRANPKLRTAHRLSYCVAKFFSPSTLYLIAHSLNLLNVIARLEYCRKWNQEFSIDTEQSAELVH